MRFQAFIAALTLTVASLFAPAQAAPITYDLIGSMSGQLDSTTFTNRVFVWEITGDTNQKETIAGFTAVPAKTVAFEIGGVGVLTPSNPLFAVTGAPVSPTFAFATADLLSGIGFDAPQLASYDGLSTFGPVSVNLSGTFPLTTLEGTLVITSLSGTMFDATVVPEPITLTLFGAGMASIGVVRRRRKALP